MEDGAQVDPVWVGPIGAKTRSLGSTLLACGYEVMCSPDVPDAVARRGAKLKLQIWLDEWSKSLRPYRQSTPRYSSGGRERTNVFKLWRRILAPKVMLVHTTSIT